jgi:hypothetical protein
MRPPSTAEADNGDPLTEEEARAIRSLRVLARLWPRSLTLASMGGSLVVFHTGDPRWDASLGTDRAKAVLADDFSGIPNDGGDW